MKRSGEEMKKVIFSLLAVLFISGCSFKIPFLPEEQSDQRPIIDDIDGEPEEKINETKEPPSELDLEATYFNVIKEVNGLQEILNPDNILALVNKEFVLPGNYVPDNLIRPNVPFSFGDQDIEKSYLRQEAAEALENMFSGAKKDGIHLFAVSGYRSYNRQVAILNNEIDRVGEDKAVQAVAYPGKSEHQTGLAMDISSESAQFYLTEEFGELEEGIWLKDHAHLYGFILRYPKGLENITGYQYEPWHFRFVGEKAAKIIYENKWTLEEFFEEVEKI